jgi:hypothetical protein
MKQTPKEVIVISREIYEAEIMSLITALADKCDEFGASFIVTVPVKDVDDALLVTNMHIRSSDAGIEDLVDAATILIGEEGMKDALKNGEESRGRLQ